jgi:hypothetical protein
MTLKKAVLLILIAGILTHITMCGKSSGDGDGDGDTSGTPTLFNLGIDFDDFNFDILGDRDPIFVFGDILTGTQLNPTFEYYLVEGSTIIAPVNGTVNDVGYRADTEDYSIVIIPEGASSWWVVLDHVLNPVVSADETVSAGDTLGVAGTWELGQGRTELQVINNDTGLSYCPFDYFDSESSTTVEGEVTDLMNSWEEYKGDTDIYDQSSMSKPGCLESTVQG